MTLLLHDNAHPNTYDAAFRGVELSARRPDLSRPVFGPLRMSVGDVNLLLTKMLRNEDLRLRKIFIDYC